MTGRPAVIVAGAEALSVTIGAVCPTGDPALVAGRCIAASNQVLSSISPPAGTAAQLVRVVVGGLEHWAVAVVPLDSADDPAWMLVGDPTIRQFGADLPHPYVAEVDCWVDALAGSQPGPGTVSVWLVDPDADDPAWVYPDAAPWRTVHHR